MPKPRCPSILVNNRHIKARHVSVVTGLLGYVDGVLNGIGLADLGRHERNRGLKTKDV